MSDLPELLGQGDECARRLVEARALSMHHAILIEGPRGLGKSLAARHLAAALLGSEDRHDATARRIVSGNHPDLHLVEVPEGKHDIPVESVRELQSVLERSPVEGRARVALVDPADRLNEQGQNALLKTLEEPGPATFLILVARRPEALLDTVRSRMARLRILPVADDLVRRALHSVPDLLDDDDRIARVVAQARGSIGLGLELASEEGGEIERAVAEFLADPESMEPESLAALAQAGKDKAASEHRAELVFTALRLQVRGQLDAALAADTRRLYARAEADQGLGVLDALLDAEGDVTSGIPAAQVLEGWAVRYQAARRSGR